MDDGGYAEKIIRADLNIRPSEELMDWQLPEIHAHLTSAHRVLFDLGPEILRHVDQATSTRFLQAVQDIGDCANALGLFLDG